MNNTKSIISKKYVRSLLSSFNQEEINSIENILKLLTNLFGLKKFVGIIESPQLKSTEKKDFIISIVDTNNNKIVNFLSLLCEHNRLTFIPDIYKELKFQLAIKNDCFEGKVISDTEISKTQLNELEKSFSKKFGSTIKLEPILADYSGIKIQIIDIGVEVSLSLDRLKSQMAEHILKAI